MAASNRSATSTGGNDLAEKIKNFFKQCSECWKRTLDKCDEVCSCCDEGCCSCCKSNKGKSNPGPVGSGYVKPRSDLDDLPGKKDRDSGGYKEGVKETSFSKPDSSPPPPPLPAEPYRSQLDEYEVHTIQDFPFKSFKSDTYKGVHDVVLLWVKPLHYHPRLQGAFLSFAQPPKLMEKLEILSKSLQGMAKALSTKKRIPQNEHKELVPVLDDLSHDPGIKLDQMKSLIIVCEAMKEFPRHIVELCIKSLTPNKRQRLIEFIWCIPYGTNKKVFTDPDSTAIFMDPDLQPIMKRIGFKKESFSSDLIWDSPDDDEEDKLGAALFLLEGSHKKY